MSNPNYTALLLIMDASGSMNEWLYNKDGEHATDEKDKRLSRSDGMVMAGHKMLEQQARKLAGYLTVDYATFNDYLNYKVEDADPLTLDLGYIAGGYTHMYDATAEALEKFENRISAMPEDEQPGHVVVVIFTDGDSQGPYDQRGHDLPARTKRLMNKGWDFAFLGAYVGSVDRAIYGLGIPRSSGIEDDFTSEGIERMVGELNKFISTARGGGEAKF